LSADGRAAPPLRLEENHPISGAGSFRLFGQCQKAGRPRRIGKGVGEPFGPDVAIGGGLPRPAKGEPAGWSGIANPCGEDILLSRSAGLSSTPKDRVAAAALWIKASASGIPRVPRVRLTATSTAENSPVTPAPN